MFLVDALGCGPVVVGEVCSHKRLDDSAVERDGVDDPAEHGDGLSGLTKVEVHGGTRLSDPGYPVLPGGGVGLEVDPAVRVARDVGVGEGLAPWAWSRLWSFQTAHRRLPGRVRCPPNGPEMSTEAGVATRGLD